MIRRKKVDKRSPEVAARDVLETEHLGALERAAILLRWQHTMDKFSNLVEYTAVKRFDRQTQEKVAQMIGPERLEALRQMGLVPIEKPLYLALKDAEYEERMRQQKSRS
ncbi:hypothetical protein JI721_04575 [Alicyclobacillus cycloheptanicus]|uniref:Uncharacterized protein n=1 Tax=Alicyclobacillus cycloheptanicus TaxID=1457 RepID=A0ABT9XLK3_9BACL|nr:hypothetical protein [Alicyclobacillus cycloheptanicus]MDQ0191187.1 hypothetical protein [Alicyclobacillus cycloheptanicus]WDM02104.1 hypothetical protein JI721_04575 [Alicyclobacillus cycloheptanicus]